MRSYDSNFTPKHRRPSLGPTTPDTRIDFHPILRGRRFFYDPAEVERYAEQHSAKRCSSACATATGTCRSGVEDFNTINRLKSLLKRAEERIRELEATLKISETPMTDGHAGDSLPSAEADPPQEPK